MIFCIRAKTKNAHSEKSTCAGRKYPKPTAAIEQYAVVFPRSRHGRPIALKTIWLSRYCTGISGIEGKSRCRPASVKTMVGMAKPIQVSQLPKSERDQLLCFAISSGRMVSGKESFSLSTHCSRMMAARQP